MKLEQATGRHLRLQRELAVAYSAVPWQTEWIDRLANDLADAEREIAGLRPLLDRSSVTLPTIEAVDRV